jgi:hypothetical protein
LGRTAAARNNRTATSQHEPYRGSAGLPRPSASSARRIIAGVSNSTSAVYQTQKGRRRRGAATWGRRHGEAPVALGHRHE